MTKIVKRDGRIVPFDTSRLTSAVSRAFSAAGQDLSPVPGVVSDIVDATSDLSEISVSRLQVYVERSLNKNFPDISKIYSEYRTTRDKKRVSAMSIDHSLGRLLVNDKSVVNENANKDSRVFNTRRDLMAGSVAKPMGLAMLPESVSNAHIKGDIHYHDLDYSPFMPMTNCCLVDFKSMLAHGYSMGNADISTPQSIGVATAQVAQIILNVAASQYGGISGNRLDEVLEPYAVKSFYKNLKMFEDAFGYETNIDVYDNGILTSDDPVVLSTIKKTKKDIFSAMQSLENHISATSASTGQTPFTTVNFGLGTSWICTEIQRSILQVRLNGLGPEHRTPIFPKLVFTLKDGINLRPTDPNYDIKKLAAECTAKRMYPDILSYDKVVQTTGSFKSPMGCRSFLSEWYDENGVETSDGRMNLGVVTLNLPRIALETKDNRDNFWKLLDERLEIVHTALRYRIDRCREATPQSAPILYQQGVFSHRLADDEDVTPLFENFRATVSIGYIGLYEVGRIFCGANWEDNQENVDFVKSVLVHLYDKALSWSKEEGYKYSVYGTPSESLTDRFCRLDTDKFGIIEDITDKKYYTNSFHQDIRKHSNPFDKILFEEQFTPYTPGGQIVYVEADCSHNLEAIETIWDFAYDHVMYYAINTPISICHLCSYHGDMEPTEDGFKCPSCGNEDYNTLECVNRMCGYLGQVNKRGVVEGRLKEIQARVKHDL